MKKLDTILYFAFIAFALSVCVVFALDGMNSNRATKLANAATASYQAGNIAQGDSLLNLSQSVLDKSIFNKINSILK